jgi:hypothetical protein
MAENGEIKIEKGVPLPSNARGPLSKLPFEQMEIGDSVFFPGKKAAQMSGYLAKSRHLGKQFTARTLDGGCRIWRIA